MLKNIGATAKTATTTTSRHGTGQKDVIHSVMQQNQKAFSEREQHISARYNKN